MLGKLPSSLFELMVYSVLSASVCWAKKTFQSEQSVAGGRVSGVHPAIQDRSKISWV